MGTSLNGQRRKFRRVYVIYSADIVGSASDMERMSPAQHLTAGYTGDRRAAGEKAAARFRQTEGDSEYAFEYLARYEDSAYLPAADRPDDYEGDGYQGRHRKWTAELTREEWLLFAKRYYVDLDADGYPEQYEDTEPALTEYGLLEAVSVDNSEGWQPGPEFVNSSFYVSFSGPQEEPREEDPDAWAWS